MFIKFIKQLIKDADRKIYLILDNLRVHHARVVKEWMEDYTEKIELFFLPAYSKRQNPPGMPDYFPKLDHLLLSHTITSSVLTTKLRSFATQAIHLPGATRLRFTLLGTWPKGNGKEH